MVGVALASVFTLGVLGLFLFIVSALVFLFGGLYGAFGLGGILVLEAVLFLVFWRVGPWLSDLIYKFLYGARWLSYEELAQMDAGVAQFIQELCRRENIKPPKIGFIDDDNPQAFTYGSDHWNARLIFTRGVFAFLDGNERKAVFAHELGHIVHRDFIIMTLASFILTVLYTLGRVFYNTRSEGKKKGGLALVGLLSLVFYYVGSYLLLFLSRTREYWADAYAREKTGSGNYLSTALVKIAYGIVHSKDSEKTKHLMEGTRTLGIYDHKASKNFGLVGADFVQNSDSQAVTNAMVYDKRNLWAFWLELSSSHPLTGKRIAALLSGEANPVFDMQKVERYPFDNARHYLEFAMDWMAGYGAVLLLIGAGWLFMGLSGAVLGAGVGLLAKAFYKYPSAPAHETTIDELMADVYASPIKGKPCTLNGQLVGRGVPGYALSEDFMFKDRTGLLYLDYQNLLPLVGNWIFALTRAKAMIGKTVSCKGWFFRGFGQSLMLDYLQVEGGGEKLVSYQKTFAFLIAGIFIVAGLAVRFVLHA